MSNVEFKQVTTSNGVSSGFVSVNGETFAFSAKAGEWVEVEPKDADDLDYKRQERDEAQKAVEKTYHVKA